MKKCFHFFEKKKKDRVRYIGYGEIKPTANSSTDEGRQHNRRVEFLVLQVR